VPRRLATLLAALGAACASRSITEPRFERPIRVEAASDGTLRVDGQAADWGALEEAIRSAVRARPSAPGFRPSAIVRVDVACPEGTWARLLGALDGAGVKEILAGDVRG
jgi:biopolymer transport protein ExbD